QLYKLGQANVAHSNTTSLSQGLVGYWPLDGNVTNWSTGKTFDLSGRGNTGFIQFATLATTTAPTAGKIGQALQFTGSQTNPGIPVLNNSSLAMTSAITMSAWVKVTGNTSAQQVIMARWGGSNAYALSLNSSCSGGINPCVALSLGGDIATISSPT